MGFPPRDNLWIFLSIFTQPRLGPPTAYLLVRSSLGFLSLRTVYVRNPYRLETRLETHNQLII